MTEIKKIVIKQETTKEGTTTSFEIDGLSDFEVIGLLSYYIDAFKVGMIRKTESQNNNSTEISKAK